MKSTRKTLIILLNTLVAMICSSAFVMASQSDEKALYEENRLYLEKQGVPQEKIIKLKNEDLNSVVRQGKAYRFSYNQIESMVDGYIYEYSHPEVSDAIYGEKDEKGNYNTPHGKAINRYNSLIFGNDYFDDNLKSIKLQSPPTNSLMSYNSAYRNVVNANDQSGVHWVIQSGTGYTEATAFIILPSLYSVSWIDRPYMFFAANTNPSSIIGDYGIVYFPGDGWRAFKNAGVWNSTTRRYDMTWANSYFTIPTSISRLYIHLKITNTASTDRITIRVLDGYNFNNVLWSYTQSFSGNPIYGSASNLNIYREITMAQDLESAGTRILNTGTGSRMNNARFETAYLYNSSGYWSWGTAQTSDAFRRAPTSQKLNTVIVNSYAKWGFDNISIRFTQ